MGLSLYRMGIKLALAASLIFVGLAIRPYLWKLPADATYYQLYWAGTAFVVAVLAFGRVCQTMVSLFRFPLRMKGLLPGEGKPRLTLYQAVLAMHREQEERALAILDQLPADLDPKVRETAGWLRYMAGLRCLKRQRRPVSSYRERYPQTHALLFGNGQVLQRRQNLARELAAIPSPELDRLARGYVDLADRLLEALSNPRSPFHAQAEEMLFFMTGRTYMVNARERFAAWWKAMKPQLQHGGGAFLAAARLMQREYYSECSQLLDRVSAGGLLSCEAETTRRMARYYAMFTRPQWRLTAPDIPRYFRDLHYLHCADMGVLRYPAAELPEVIACCQRAKDLRASKISFIKDLFKLWDATGDELARPIANLLKRLMSHDVRPSPTRIAYWAKLWDEKQDEFEEPVLLMMEGVAAASGGHLAAAAKLFEQAAKKDATQSTPFVNMVYLRLASGKEDEARKLSDELIQRFPHEPAVYVAMGRLFSLHLNEPSKAEKLFVRAYELDRGSTEPLICLGELKLADGKYNESQDYFDRARQIDPGSPEAKLGLARIYMETKRWELAVQYLHAVVQESNGDTQHLAHYLLYRTYRELGNDRLAIEYLDKVPPGFFKEPEVLDDIAFHLETEKHYAKARVFSERAMLLRARGRDTGLMGIGGLLPPPDL